MLIWRFGGRVLPVILCGTTLTACAPTETTGTVTTTDPACAALGVIRYSASQDSAETVRQVRGHNAAWRVLCGE